MDSLFRHRRLSAGLPIVAAFAVLVDRPVVARANRGAPWAMHVIDNSLSGADGVRLADVNGDGLPDITTGWEEGNAVRAYIHPGHAAVTTAWPAVTVGQAGSTEDAVFVDLDDDGAVDVVSAGQGSQTLFVHWAPANPGDYLNPGLWETVKIPASIGHGWMFTVPMDVDGRNGIDLVSGGEGTAPKIAWFECPAGNRRNLAAWNMHVMSEVAWTMSLIPYDVDNDGDVDVIVTDRYNNAGLQGARWLENPGTGSPLQMSPWPNHFIGAQGKQAMLSVIEDLDRDGLDDLIVPTQGVGGLSFFRRTDRVSNSWKEYPIAKPPDTGAAKGCNVGDIDLDGDPDIVFSFAAAASPLSGMVWLSYANAPTDPVWQDHEISGPAGEKFDIVALADLDGDGDLDVITTEENEPPNSRGLGVIWYENPTITPLDTDHDGVPDASDNCLLVPNPSQEDLDEDDIGDACDDDVDGDGALNTGDNCPTTSNADQADADADMVGDVCDHCAGTIPHSPVDATGCPPPIPGDCDRDGDVDQKDFGHMQACLSGRGAVQALPDCQKAHLDADDDVDEADMLVFHRCISGPDVPADPGCAE